MSNKKVDYIIPMEKSLGADTATNLLLKSIENDVKRAIFCEIEVPKMQEISAFRSWR